MLMENNDGEMESRRTSRLFCGLSGYRLAGRRVEEIKASNRFRAHAISADSVARISQRKACKHL
jgi:hypothetical protein